MAVEMCLFFVQALLFDLALFFGPAIFRRIPSRFHTVFFSLFLPGKAAKIDNFAHWRPFATFDCVMALSFGLRQCQT
jgi:hypothetical protein